jgi:hypothetical protein
MTKSTQNTGFTLLEVLPVHELCKVRLTLNLILNLTLNLSSAIVLFFIRCFHQQVTRGLRSLGKVVQMFDRVGWEVVIFD